MDITSSLRPTLERALRKEGPFVPLDYPGLGERTRRLADRLGIEASDRIEWAHGRQIMWSVIGLEVPAEAGAILRLLDERLATVPREPRSYRDPGPFDAVRASKAEQVEYLGTARRLVEEALLGVGASEWSSRPRAFTRHFAPGSAFFCRDLGSRVRAIDVFEFKVGQGLFVHSYVTNGDDMKRFGISGLFDLAPFCDRIRAVAEVTAWARRFAGLSDALFTEYRRSCANTSAHKS